MKKRTHRGDAEKKIHHRDTEGIEKT